MQLGAAPLALVALCFACQSAIAQGQAPNATPAAGTSPATAGRVAGSRPVPLSAPPAATGRRRAAAHADARVCLEFPTELQVIACAEKYRWAKAR